MMLTISLVGRPNVGKSTLFNRLVGKRVALVHNEPGITRDRRFGIGRISDLSFNVIDTPGLDVLKNGDLLSEGLRYQTERALEESQLFLFVLDARSGILPLDEEWARTLRTWGKPCILVINKAENRLSDRISEQARSLGFGAPIPLSAEHGEGLSLLYEALQHFCDASSEIVFEHHSDFEERSRPLRLAVVGRPNAGKSTLINKIIGDNRFLTGPMAGLTRDTQSVSFEWEGRPVELFDTAGIRKRSKILGGIEKQSVEETRHAIQFAESVLLVVDATKPLEKQDLTLAQHIVEEGRLLMIVLNKTDLVEDMQAFLKEVKLRIGEQLPQIAHLPMVHVSALSGRHIENIFPKLFELYQLWNLRLSTGQLNKWLGITLDRHPPPLVKGRRLKIRYMTQIKTRPPTFVLFASQVRELPESYLRYLKNRLARDLSIEGIPLRFLLRSGKNPYV